MLTENWTVALIENWTGERIEKKVVSSPEEVREIWPRHSGWMRIQVAWQGRCRASFQPHIIEGRHEVYHHHDQSRFWQMGRDLHWQDYCCSHRWQAHLQVLHNWYERPIIPSEGHGTVDQRKEEHGQETQISRNAVSWERAQPAPKITTSCFYNRIIGHFRKTGNRIQFDRPIWLRA